MNEEHAAHKKLNHILIAEDSEHDACILADVFARMGMSDCLKIVRDGEEALDYLRKKPPYEGVPTPSMVLLDINMPQKTGFEVLEAVKCDPLLKSLPVIMRTSSDRDEDIVRSYGNGASTYITKPVGFDAFEQIIQKFNLYWSTVAKLLSQRGRDL